MTTRHIPQEVKNAEQLEKENADLRQRLDDLNKEIAGKQPSKDPDMEKYMSELNMIHSLGKDTSNSIQVVEKNDHKNVSLWVIAGLNIGKRIGPLHPVNAEKTFKDFWSRGIRLSTTRPTEKEIADYKATDEYKTLLEAHKKKRAIKDKSKKKENLEKLIEKMAELTGQNAEALTKILSPEQVGKK
jgi:hypothetical protein